MPKLVKKPDGTKILTFADGTVQTFLPNGTKITRKPDGTKTTVLKSGAIAEKRDDGVKVQRFKDGGQVEVFPDGRRVQVNADGTRIESAADGTVVQTNRDGTRITTHPNGDCLQQNPDGTSMKVFSDGRKVQINAEGTELTTFPNGRRKQVSKDGTQIDVYPDGRQVQLFPTGAKIETLADGTRTDTFASGKTVCQRPDGTKTTRYASGKVSVVAPDGTRVDTSTSGRVVEYKPDGTKTVLKGPIKTPSSSPTAQASTRKQLGGPGSPAVSPRQMELESRKVESFSLTKNSARSPSPSSSSSSAAPAAAAQAASKRSETGQVMGTLATAAAKAAARAEAFANLGFATSKGSSSSPPQGSGAKKPAVKAPTVKRQPPVQRQLAKPLSEWEKKARSYTGVVPQAKPPRASSDASHGPGLPVAIGEESPGEEVSVEVEEVTEPRQLPEIPAPPSVPRSLEEEIAAFRPALDLGPNPPKLMHAGLLIEETTVTRVMTALLLADGSFILGEHSPKPRPLSDTAKLIAAAEAPTPASEWHDHPPRHVASLLILGAAAGFPASADIVMGPGRARVEDPSRKFVLNSRPRSYLFTAPNAEAASAWVEAVRRTLAQLPALSRFDELSVGPVWEEDWHSQRCRLCRELFNATTRPRYHCRFCGKVVCPPCGSARMPILTLGIENSAQGLVCKMCVPLVAYNNGHVRDVRAAQGQKKAKANTNKTKST